MSATEATTEIPMTDERAIELLTLANRCVHEVRRGAIEGHIYPHEVHRRLRALQHMAGKVAKDQRRLARMAEQPLVDDERRPNELAALLEEMPADFDAWRLRLGDHGAGGFASIVATRSAGNVSVRIVEFNRGVLRTRMARVERDLGDLFDHLENLAAERESQ